ncbi:MAG: restriction endonuclease subunit S [Deltaproteobacteria bacterium]|nr:restriction endonuclease subunit S [Deltaproteobacteria bacterium]
MSQVALSTNADTAWQVENYSLPSNSLVNSQGLRMDAGHYNPELLNALRTLHGSGMRVKRLAEISAGVFIPPRFKRIYVEKEHGVPFLQGTHIVHFQPADLKYLSRTSRRLDKWIIEAGWILVTCSGTIGRVTICPAEWDKWAASQHILRIVPDEDVCPAGYLWSFLASPLGQIQLTANIYGAVVDELTQEQAQSILIPVPETVDDKRLMSSVDTAMREAISTKSRAVALAGGGVRNLSQRFGN